MKNIVAFMTVLIVWSTTPLAIKFAALGASAFFIASWRMVIAAALCFVILALKHTKLEVHKFWREYAVASIGIFVTLGLVYVSAMYVDSGMIAVIFAITPLVTGLMSNVVFKNNDFNIHKIIATTLGFLGVAIIFLKYNKLHMDYLYVVILFFAMAFQSFISIEIKRLKSKASALQTTTGGILFSLPFFIISFLFVEGKVPEISTVSVVTTIYLAVFGSVFGFIAYYYLIKNVTIFTVGIISLLTPVFALIIGVYFNDEFINSIQIMGMMVVLLSLVYYQFYAKRV